MSAKRPFIEPRIVADNELDVASQDFPLMPLVALSGGVSDVADSAPPDGFDAPDGIN